MSVYLSGQWNAICDRCGFKFKSGELKKDWQGLMVCDKDFELRNQQDLIRVKAERAIPTWSRPRPVEAFLLSNPITEIIYMESGEGYENNMQNYVDPTYLLEDYIAPEFLLQVSYSRGFSDVSTLTDTVVYNANKGISDVLTTSDTIQTSFLSYRDLVDPVTVTDSGYTSIANYVEYGYMSEDYAQDVVTF